MKETAVEWLVDQVEKLIPTGNQIIIGIILEKAKQMEKQQILDAYKLGKWDARFRDIDSNKFYEETYGK